MFNIDFLKNTIILPRKWVLGPRHCANTLLSSSFSNLKFVLRPNLCLQIWRLCDGQTFWGRFCVLSLVIKIFTFFPKTLCKIVMVYCRRRPLFSLLAVFSCSDLHHSSFDGSLIHSIFFVFVIEILVLLLHLTLVARMASFLSFQIERLDYSQLFIVQQNFVRRANYLIELRHGSCFEEFFGRSVATCTDWKWSTLLTNDFSCWFVQLKTVIPCEFCSSLAHQKWWLLIF